MKNVSMASVVGVCVALAVAGCGSGSRTGPGFVAKAEPWRADDELACLAAGVVRESTFIAKRQALGGPGPCGAQRPFEVAATADGRVELKPVAMLRCPMVPAVDVWVRDVVNAAAQHHFRQPVVEVKVGSSYSCRPVNHVDGGKLSEHGHANALDVSGFRLADGRWITVKGGWWGGDVRERAFLRDVHAGGCKIFTTVLGPLADAMHRDHFHLDLAKHGRDGMTRICR